MTILLTLALTAILTLPLLVDFLTSMIKGKKTRMAAYVAGNALVIGGAAALTYFFALSLTTVIVAILAAILLDVTINVSIFVYDILKNSDVTVEVAAEA